HKRRRLSSIRCSSSGIGLSSIGSSSGSGLATASCTGGSEEGGLEPRRAGVLIEAAGRNELGRRFPGLHQRGRNEVGHRFFLPLRLGRRFGGLDGWHDDRGRM